MWVQLLNSLEATHEQHALDFDWVFAWRDTWALGRVSIWLWMDQCIPSGMQRIPFRTRLGTHLSCAHCLHFGCLGNCLDHLGHYEGHRLAQESALEAMVAISEMAVVAPCGATPHLGIDSRIPGFSPSCFGARAPCRIPLHRFARAPRLDHRIDRRFRCTPSRWAAKHREMADCTARGRVSHAADLQWSPQGNRSAALGSGSALTTTPSSARRSNLHHRTHRERWRDYPCYGTWGSRTRTRGVDGVESEAGRTCPTGRQIHPCPDAPSELPAQMVWWHGLDSRPTDQTLTLSCHSGATELPWIIPIRSVPQKIPLRLTRQVGFSLY